jgi:hypothetical protein
MSLDNFIHVIEQGFPNQDEKDQKSNILTQANQLNARISLK